MPRKANSESLPIEPSAELNQPQDLNLSGAQEANSPENLDKSVAIEHENQILKSQVADLMRGLAEVKNSISTIAKPESDADKPELGKVIHGKGSIPTDFEGNIIIDSNMVAGTTVKVLENGAVVDEQMIVYKTIDGTEKKVYYRDFATMIGRNRKPALAKDYIVWGRGATATSLYHYPNMPVVREIERTKEMEVFVGKRFGNAKDDVEYDMTKTIKIKKHLWN